MKKILALFMAVLMLGTIFAGCGSSGSNFNDDADAQVTLSIALPWAEQKDAQNVVAEINKKLENLLPNTQIALTLDSGMADKWSLWMSTQREIDIAHSGYATNIEDEVRNESYLELNDLVEEYAPNIKALQKEYWYSYDNATINGVLYAIPNTQYLLKETLGITIWEEALEHFDVKALHEAASASDKTSKEFWDVFTKCMIDVEKAGIDCSSVVNLNLYKIAKRGYHFIGGEDSNLCYDNSDDVKIVDFYTTDEFKYFCDTMKDWAKRGWVSKDILTGQWSAGLYARETYRYGLNEETGEIVQPAYTIIDLNDPEKDVLVTNIGENKTYYSIPFTSLNPVRAIKFLDLINSEKGLEVANMLAFGIEGKHYEVTNAEKDEIKAFEYEGQGDSSVSYGIPMWMCGNMMLLNNIYPYTEDFKEYGKDFHLNRVNKLKKHKLYGFSFELEEVNTKLSKIMKNNGEYAESIYCGIVSDSDKLKDELLSKNKAAGLEDVMAALQSQVDEYLK